LFMHANIEINISDEQVEEPRWLTGLLCPSQKPTMAFSSSPSPSYLESTNLDGFPSLLVTSLLSNPLIFFLLLFFSLTYNICTSLWGMIW
jgi:hypothetical protein